MNKGLDACQPSGGMQDGLKHSQIDWSLEIDCMINTSIKDRQRDRYINRKIDRQIDRQIDRSKSLHDS